MNDLLSTRLILNRQKVKKRGRIWRHESSSTSGDREERQGIPEVNKHSSIGLSS